MTPAVKRHQTTPGLRLNTAWDYAWDSAWMLRGTTPENDALVAPKRPRNDDFWSPTQRRWLVEWRPALLWSSKVAPKWCSSRRRHLLCLPMTPRVASLGAHNSAKAALLAGMRRRLIAAWTAPKMDTWTTTVTKLEWRLKCALNDAWTTPF